MGNKHQHNLTRTQIVSHARAIAQEYQAQGLTLTLRQMYYQFVARGLEGSGQRVYNRIGATLTDARYNGTFPVEWLEDRGRNVVRGASTRNDINVSHALDTAGDWLRGFPELMLDRARWYGQLTYVSVWVEKEALAGVFEPTCDSLGVGWFACKGYPSISALKQWLDQANSACADTGFWRSFDYGPLRMSERHRGKAEKCVVLYFGDHDPDGWEIPRSAARNIERIRALGGYASFNIQFVRVALNMDQIQQYEPPPFDAKVTSSRYQGYIEEHDTNDAWELDALEPTVLRNLITEHVESYFDEGIHDENVNDIEDLRESMAEQMREDGWAATTLEE